MWRHGGQVGVLNNYSSSPNGLSQQPTTSKAERAIDSWVIEGEKNNCFSKIQLAGQKKYRDLTSFAS